MVAVALALGTACQAAPRSGGQVGVWYIPFWTAGDEFGHWKHVEDRKAAMPLGGRYASNDPEVIERQWRQMRACGISFLVMDDTNTVHVDSSLIDRNIRAWFDFMDRQRPQDRIPIAIAAGGELNQHANRQAWADAVEYLWKQYAHRASYKQMDGKPLLLWYIEKDVWPDWTDARWTVKKAYTFFRADAIYRNGGWGYGGDTSIPCNPECMSFHPGWDLSPPGHLREGGDLYRRLWVQTLKCHPRYVLLSDWNGWNEGTALEDSAAWTDTYSQPAPSWYRLLTRGYIAAYKGKMLDGFYYRDESSPDVYLFQRGRLVYQGACPHGVPVVLLPKGSIGKQGDAVVAHRAPR
jgi:hypothetical protein